MGRNAKLRKQRRQERQGEPALSAAEYPLFRQPRKKTQLEVATLPQPEPSESKPKSLLGRLFSRSQSDSKSSLTASADEMERFFITYQQWLGAIAWEGHQTLGSGLLLAANTAQQTVQVEYIARKNLKRYFPPDSIEAAQELTKLYEPDTEITLVYTTQSGEMMLGSPRSPDPLPPECHRLWQADELAMPQFSLSE
ncbi:MAG: hypothetical protein HC873_21225 [Leptolyngbyaceae cyanobacterium SL_1_1]|nr:hypothetical protein [Leptolyngbyaceae cyanobacterium RM1_1_2]NJO11730.1 hypothetical protein [Leptolyngbyaceae cyanobacterium SL_1_1]